MTFGHGAYIIRSLSLDSYVGRDLHEDKSLLPKRVLVLAKGIQAPHWEINRAEDGSFVLKTLGSHATEVKGHLFGVLLPEPPATRWKIEAHPRYGPHVYTIIEAGGSKGWVSPQEIHEQVLVHPLIIGPSDPPHIPHNQLFEITSVE